MCYVAVCCVVSVFCFLVFCISFDYMFVCVLWVFVTECACMCWYVCYVLLDVCFVFLITCAFLCVAAVL